MLFVLTVVEGPLIARMPIYSDPTSGVRGPDTLWRVPWTPLFDSFYASFESANAFKAFIRIKSNGNLTLKIVIYAIYDEAENEGGVLPLE